MVAQTDISAQRHAVMVETLAAQAALFGMKGFEWLHLLAVQAHRKLYCVAARRNGPLCGCGSFAQLPVESAVLEAAVGVSRLLLNRKRLSVLGATIKVGLAASHPLEQLLCKFLLCRTIWKIARFRECRQTSEYDSGDNPWD